VLGFLTLAKVLGEGALRSIYLGGLLYGAARVICVGMALLVRTNRAQLSVFVRLYRDDIVKWISRAVYFLAGVLWLIGSLELFTVREQFLAALGRVFEASVGFRSLRISIGDVASFALVVTLAYYLSRIVKIVLQEDVLTRVPLKRGVPQAMATTAQYLLLIAGFVLAVTAAGFDLDRLTLLTGAFGVGIGFGLQNVVNNFVSGLILLFERPVQVGDAVQVGATTGEITRIGIRSSTIRTYQGAEVIVPNGKLISDEVTNWTLSSQIRRVEIPVGVAYGSEPQKVIELLLDVAKSHAEILAEPAPQVLFTGFGDSSLQFELRFWTVIQVHPVVRSQIVAAILQALENAQIEIPFPQRDLRVKLDDEVVKRLVAARGKNNAE
jgi:small-conductance mechanosensitive channel